MAKKQPLNLPKAQRGETRGALGDGRLFKRENTTVKQNIMGRIKKGKKKNRGGGNNGGQKGGPQEENFTEKTY